MSLIRKMLLGMGVLFISQSALAADYRVEITNLTYQISFTPRIVIAHVPVSFFSAGDDLNDAEGGLLNGQVNNALKEIAESGSTGPMEAILEQEAIAPLVSFASGDGLLSCSLVLNLHLQAEEGFSRNFHTLSFLK